MNNVLILPNQLFEDNKLIGTNTTVYIYEHPLYFKKYNYHKLKLILHRSTMKRYAKYIEQKYKSITVKYLEYEYDVSKIFKNDITMYDPVDHDIVREFKKYSSIYKTNFKSIDTPLFMCKINDLIEYLEHNGKYHQTSFYIYHRKKLNILIDKTGKPIGGKWTFDTENRLPYPKNFNIDMHFKINNDTYIIDATRYVNKHFSNNIGDTTFYLPIDHNGAKTHLINFIENRLNCFGPYQDAVNTNIIFGCHSVISPLLNIGLLTPKQVIDEVLIYYNKNKTRVKLSSVEGFIRQIVGWREYMRFVYMFKYKELSSSNYFKHKNRLDEKWYNGTTNIQPIDDIIRKFIKYGYAHHIERLMYLGNFMLLNKIAPKEVYNWFMMFIDAYPWVMEPNVYGMSQYSCGKLLSTRPYFSSSNYIDKMSNYKTKPNVFEKVKLKNNAKYEWYEIWDALYYNFINDNKKDFSHNYALARSVLHWNNKMPGEKKQLLNIAKMYLLQYQMA